MARRRDGRRSAPPTGDRLGSTVIDHDRIGEKAIAAAQGLICLLVLLQHHGMQIGQASFGQAFIAAGLVTVLISSTLRFVWARRTPLPERGLDALSVLDVTAFVWVIWSHHVAYGLPASTALKSPSVALLFVIVALRALRYDHRQIVLTGLTAALGWLALVAAAIHKDGHSALTGSYEAYLFSARILASAEIERFGALVALAAALATSAWGARKILSQAAHVEDYALALNEARRHLEAANTARREAEASARAVAERDAEIRRQNKLFAAALENMSQGLLMLDGQMRVVVSNPRFSEIYGVHPDQIAAGVDAEALAAAIRERGCYGDEGPTSAEDIIGLAAARDGGTSVDLADGRTIAIRARPLAGGGHVVTHEDVTELRLSEARAVHLALHDPLTGLPNRTKFREQLDETIAAARGTDGAVVLLLLDLDNFKDVNDTLGHHAGDIVLKTTAQRLTRLVAPHTVARLGADEFAIVVPTTHDLAESTASQLAEAITAAVTAPVAVGEKQGVVGASIGIARAPVDTTEADALIKKADIALFGVKTDRTTSYRFFQSQMDERMRRRHLIKEGLRTASARSQFSVAYQPQLEVATGRISGFEALLRWTHPELGPISPGEFIPLAEESGTIRAVGEWVLRQACSDAASWPEDVGVAVNVSAAEFHPALVDLVTEVLAETGLAPSRLELEITESVLIDETADAIEIVDSLHALGVRVALDDFGTGYASLSYLRKFPFDKIKIDRSFVADLAAGRSGALAIIRCISDLGQSLGMHTIAEGVETLDQLEQVSREGCTTVQGYLLSKPIPANELAPLLAGDFELGKRVEACAA